VLSTAGAEEFEKNRQRLLELAAKHMAVELGRVTAPLEDLWRIRDERLRALVEHAREHSRWHGARLGSVELSSLSGSDLSMIPPMTKADLMDNWDEIVCDPRLSLELASRHLERIARDGAAFLLDEYQVVATGGSTGRRAIVVVDLESFALGLVTIQRRAFWLRLLSGEMRELPIRVASLASVNPVHMGGALNACFSQPNLVRMVPVGLSRPISEIVDLLNHLDPQVLAGYASVLHELALQKLGGALRIQPTSIESVGEPLLPEARARIEEAFGVWVNNLWGSTEGGYLASSYPRTEGLVINEDVCVLEPVDERNRPVPPGQRAAKVLVTNLLNRVMPLIRYEITDEVTLLEPLPDGPWHGRRVADIQGRQDDAFHYAGGVFVHPHLFRSVLTRVADVAEYQVVQTAEGAEVAIVGGEQLDPSEVAQSLESELKRAGLAGAAVRVSRVDRLERHAYSGKLRRFVPLPGAG
jgi:phenylacetate-coenzyme A ligase PaaK-like adenylate-forming protein